jgi:adenylate cyclase
MVRNLRLFSGLLLFLYVISHLVNHSAGFFSLEAAEALRQWIGSFWRSWLGTILLYPAMLVHLSLALYGLYARRSLRLPPWEATQILLGLVLPPLLAIHVLGTRIAHELYGLNDSYYSVLLVYFEFNPASGIRQVVVLMIAWLHGCMGLHHWLRFKPGYNRFKPYAFAAALLIPVFALMGVWIAGREVQVLAQDPAWLEAAFAQIAAPPQEEVDFLYAVDRASWVVMPLLVALVLLARVLRSWHQRRMGIITIHYPEGKRSAVLKGTSVLEASRLAGIPHASVCGGRGRCSTCRIRMGRGGDEVPDASESERKVLARVGAAPNVRLACQLVPTVDLAVVPLLPPTAGAANARARPDFHGGMERDIAVLFADLRGFTSLSEDKLPYDVVFVLNRYFAAMGSAVEQAGGHLDKFIGDGVMALFGVDKGIEDGCRDALRAARLMAESLRELNDNLQNDLSQPLRVGIGIHAGPVILGDMGYGRALSLTAIGDTVNTASRLENSTKEFSVQLVVSDSVARHAGLGRDDFAHREIEIRGKTQVLGVCLVEDATQLSGGAVEKIA